MMRFPKGFLWGAALIAAAVLTVVVFIRSGRDAATPAAVPVA